MSKSNYVAFTEKEFFVPSKITALFAVSLFAFSSYAHPGHDSKLELSTVQSVTMYAKTFGLDFNTPTNHFVGFSSVQTGSGADVEVFHADSPIDILVNQYGCTSDSISGTECNLVSQYPRCFYFADTGRFSISHFGVAFGQGIHALLAEGIESDAITAVKVWQSGTHIFSKFSFDHAGTNHSKLFACEEASRLNCSEVEYQLPHEP